MARNTELADRNDLLEAVGKAAVDLWRNTDRFAKEGCPYWEALQDALCEADVFAIGDFRS